MHDPPTPEVNAEEEIRFMNIDETDFSSIRCIIYGASPITEDVLVGAMRTTGAPLQQVYGSTETTGAITLLRAEDHDPGGPRAHLLRSAALGWGWIFLE